VQVRVGVDEQLLEERELAAERHGGHLRHDHEGDAPDLIGKLRLGGRPGRAIAGLHGATCWSTRRNVARVRQGRLPRNVSWGDEVRLVGEVRRRGDACGRVHADAEPVEDVVLRLAADEERLRVFVDEREAEGWRDLEPPFAVETHSDDRLATLGACERTGELDFLSAGLTLERRDRRRPEGCSNKTDKESSHCRPHLGSL
jgi:hypothetical protein